MADKSQFVDEAMEAIHTLEQGRANTLSPFLFLQAMDSLGPGNPQICGPLKRNLTNPDDVNIRLKVLEMLAETGRDWVDRYGVGLADEVVLSLADSNLLCAANAGRAVQFWEPGGKQSSPLLLWAKRQLPGLWEPSAVHPSQLPTLQKMLQELPTYKANLEQRRDLPNSDPSLENSVRLFGKFKAAMMSVFNRS